MSEYFVPTIKSKKKHVEIFDDQSDRSSQIDDLIKSVSNYESKRRGGDNNSVVAKSEVKSQISQAPQSIASQSKISQSQKSQQPDEKKSSQKDSKKIKFLLENNSYKADSIVSQPQSVKSNSIRPSSALGGSWKNDNKTPLDRKPSAKLLASPNFKQEKTHDYFKTTKVETCSYVKIVNGVPQAVACYKKPETPKKTPKSQIPVSSSCTNLIIKPTSSCGDTNKPLMPYKWDAHRNMLPVPEYKTPSRNGSQIQFGEGKIDTRHYVSSHKNQIGNHGKAPLFQLSNPGILSYKAQWHHSRQDK